MIISSFLGKTRGIIGTIVQSTSVPFEKAQETIDNFVHSITLPTTILSGDNNKVPVSDCDNDWVVVEPDQSTDYRPDEHFQISQEEFEQREKSRRINEATKNFQEVFGITEKEILQEQEVFRRNQEDQRLIQQLQDEEFAEKEQQKFFLNELEKEEKVKWYQNALVRKQQQELLFDSIQKRDGGSDYLGRQQISDAEVETVLLEQYQQQQQYRQYEQYQQQFQMRPEQQLQQLQNQWLMESQDEEYKLSLQMDKQKEVEQKQLEEQNLRKKVQELEEEEQKAKIKEQNELEQQFNEAVHLSIQLYQQQQRINHLKSLKIPEEPTQEDDVVRISICLLNGEKLTRKFQSSETLQTVKDFVDVQELGENGSRNIPRNYIFITDFPRKIWNDMSVKLGEIDHQKKISLRLEKVDI